MSELFHVELIRQDFTLERRLEFRGWVSDAVAGGELVAETDYDRGGTVWYHVRRGYESTAEGLVIQGGGE